MEILSCIDVECVKLAMELDSVIFFRHMSNGERQELIRASELIKYESGEFIIKDGSVEPYLYTVLEGSVQVMKERQSEEVYIATIGKGEVFGEASIFIKMPRTADIIAGDDTKVLRIHRPAFLRFLKQHHDAGMKLLMVLVFGLLQKLHEANTEISYERKAYLSQTAVDELLSEL